MLLARKSFALTYTVPHSKMPARDGEHLTPATKLLEKRREVAEVEQALATQKEVTFVSWQRLLDSATVTFLQEFQMKMETLQQRREELERKEQKLKESLLKFDKFVKVGLCTYVRKGCL